MCNQTAGLLQPIDETLVKKIHELVGSGVNCVSEMQRHLHHYVKKELFTGQQPPDLTNRLYEDSKDHILNKTTWLCDSEIHAGQILLKQKFPLVDGLRTLFLWVH